MFNKNLVAATIMILSGSVYAATDEGVAGELLVLTVQLPTQRVTSQQTMVLTLLSTCLLLRPRIWVLPSVLLLMVQKSSLWPYPVAPVIPATLMH